MKPYYQHAGITIYHGDCREVLPMLREDQQPDMVVTDPPYGMSFQSNYRAEKHAPIVGDGALDVGMIHRIITHASVAAYVFCRWDNLGDMPPPKSVLAWIKNNWSMGDLQHEHGRQWEAVCFYPGPMHAFRDRIPDVLYGDRTGNELHPTQKPTSILKRIMRATVGSSVLDPYCGSGSTLVAAKGLGIAGIGIEIEERYCEVAARRLSQEILPFTELMGTAMRDADEYVEQRLIEAERSGPETAPVNEELDFAG